MIIRALKEPWSLLLDPGMQPEEVLEGDRRVVDLPGLVSPRVVVPLSMSELPRAGQSSGSLPRAGFPFVWGKSTLQAYHLPSSRKPTGISQNLETSISVGPSELLVRQTDTLGRPQVDATDARSDSLRRWVAWQLNSFQELAQVGDDKDASSWSQAIRNGPVRRTWDESAKQWERSGEDEARMALVVRLAQDRGLRAVLASVSERPRRILERYRADTPIGRIQQLDAFCIRDFAARAGYTVAQKAGNRQQLMAVRRRETVDTYENRLTCWLYDELASMAKEYESSNRAHSRSSRFMDVKGLRLHSRKWRRSELLADVTTSRVTHPAAPNYPLQFNLRYKRIYHAYRQVLRERQVEDDAWKWLRNLWGETSRQLLACALIAAYGEEYSSTPYYRREGITGYWTETPVAPGPFDTPFGRCYLLDARDVHSNTFLSAAEALPEGDALRYVGASGCEQILMWPESSRCVLVWHLVDCCSDYSVPLAQSAKALRQLENDVRRFTGSRMKFAGLLMRPDISQDANDASGGVVIDDSRDGDGGTVVLLSIAAEAHRLVDDIREGVTLAIESVLS